MKQAAENERLREALRVQQVACEDLKTSIAQAELTCGLFPRACMQYTKYAIAFLQGIILAVVESRTRSLMRVISGSHVCTCL